MHIMVSEKQSWQFLKFRIDFEINLDIVLLHFNYHRKLLKFWLAKIKPDEEKFYVYMFHLILC